MASTQPVKSKPIQVNDYGNGHVVRYYMLDGEMRVEETCNGKTLDSTMSEFLTGDLMERARFFFGHQSGLASGPTKRTSP
jgi:hypothetical protein